MKDYLTGYAPDDAAQPASGERRPHDPHEDIRGDRDYDTHDERADAFDADTNRAPSSLGGAYSWDSADAHDRQGRAPHDSDENAYAGFAGDRYDDNGYDNHHGFDDAHPDNRATGRGLAWDDDDDYGDPTGFSPAEEPQDSTARHVPAGGGARPPRPVSPRERPWLKIDGQRYPLLGAITVLGRDDEADIIIDDPGVSRSHSEIRITHDGPHLVMSARDLASTNGTYVNGERIDSTHVHDGDRLTLGRTSMTIHLGDRT
ncbi:FHA domain-containing protein [Dermacoccus sp. 147Ba]|nr:FHA domain-containing protein [Dermacoccus sp. 147Ba]